METIEIAYVGSHPTLEYAAQEMRTALRKGLHPDCRIVVAAEEAYLHSARHTLWIGLMESFPGLPVPVVAEPALDDAIHIEATGFHGIIAGINPRSALLAAYRYLTVLGFRWVRPGADGEAIPAQLPMDLPVKIAETASYRHRGICLEGAASYENVAELIDWAPKIGFNSYFIQFMRPYTFFERWYSHRGNPYWEAEPISLERIAGFVRSLEQEIKKRGLIYHAVGHGWTCEPFGLAGLGWDPQQAEAPSDVLPYLAEVNGHRGLWRGVPLDTNLCYSNPDARKIVVASILHYVTANPAIDYLHVWLADGTNNQCECPDCRAALPSDFYVRLLNELDEQLSQASNEVKIVFLAYVDLLWPPEVESFVNPERFTLMFAPITRTYSSSFQSKQVAVDLPHYERNKLVFPKDASVNLGLLQGWQQVFQGDSFAFDYHFMWDHLKDPGYYRVAEVLSEDLKHLRKIGLNGYISCQTQRAFFPTGFGMYAMGMTLWNEHTSLEELAEDYFTAAFGAHGRACKAYLARLSELFDPPYIRKEKTQESPASKQRFAQIPALVDSFREAIDAGIQSNNRCQQQSWAYLRYHAKLCELLAASLAAKAGADHEQAWQIWLQAKEYARRIERDVQPVFDVFEFISTWEKQYFRAAN